MVFPFNDAQFFGIYRKTYNACISVKVACTAGAEFVSKPALHEIECHALHMSTADLWHLKHICSIACVP